MKPPGDAVPLPPAARREPASYLAVFLFAAIAMVIAGRTFVYLEVPGRPELPNYGMQDFRDIVYYPVRTLLAGDNPYSPSAIRRHFAPGSIFPLYTPIQLAVHLPYGFLSQRTAELLHFLLNVALTLALAFASLRLCGVTPTVGTVCGLGSFLAASRGGYMNLFYGENSAYLVLATYGALRFGRRRPRLAAGCLAFACMKPTFGVPLGILLLATGAVEAAVLGGALALVASAVVGAFVVHAAGGLAPFLASLRENVTGWKMLPEASGATGIMSIDTIALVDRLRGLPAAAETMLSVAILALGALTTGLAARRRPAEPLVAECIASATILAFAHHQFYDVLLLTLPFTALVSGRLPLPGGVLGARVRALLIVLLVIAFFNHGASYEILNGLGLVGATRLVVVSATGAAIALVLLVLIATSLAPLPRARPLPP